MNKTPNRWITIALDHPRTVVHVMVLTTVALLLMAGLPTLLPTSLGFMHPIAVDVDPENMLSADEPVRVFHDQAKKRFDLHDAIVLGVVNDKHPDGVFNVATLRAVFEITEYIKGLDGVIEADVMAPSTIDDVENTGPKTLRFSWLMPKPPTTEQAARRIRDRVMRIPFLRGTLFSADGKSLAIYIPLESKSLSYRISNKIKDKLSGIDRGTEKFHIAGLPVAEDTFGVEMFTQMAISAPVAMLVIFGLMWLFFRRFIVIAAPMVIAMVAAMSTMALLVITGNKIHIMSSMIPIFIMPIAVLDGVHIISDFFDRYEEGCDRRELVTSVMRHLFSPMLFTSLTTTAGFASLALTPIPPVQVFGLFVGFGVMLAWLWTVLFIPAYLILIPERKLAGFGRAARVAEEPDGGGLMGLLDRVTHRYAKLIVLGAMAVVAVSVIGIRQININDNPTKWFEADHPIRVADRELNAHFGGTYDGFLVFEHAEPRYDARNYARQLTALAETRRDAIMQTLSTVGEAATSVEATDAIGMIDALDARYRAAKKAESDPDRAAGHEAVIEFLSERFNEQEEIADAGTAPPFDHAAFAAQLATAAKRRLQTVDQSFAKLRSNIRSALVSSPESARAFRADVLRGGAEVRGYDPASVVIEEAAQANQVFKRPDVLAYLERVQQHLATIDVVGKSNSLVDIVKTVNRDLISGKQTDYRIPTTRKMVAQSLDQYQSSHRKADLWHFVTPDYTSAVIWIQLTSGDNQDMSRVLASADEFIKANPGPVALQEHRWFGLTYINVVWQEKMVHGMMRAFLGSFVVVLLMMMFLFRSVLWGLLSMIPLSLSVGLIYGLIGLLGVDYDMPVAVLSSLSLGLAVDYAIHFLARSRQLREQHGSWDAARPSVFGEPARAISRNIIVVGLGFTPLLLAPLVPYQTVGLLIAAILLVAGAATLLILPALLSLLRRWMFGPTEAGPSGPLPRAHVREGGSQ